MSNPNLATVEIEVYEPHHEKPGYLNLVRRKTPKEVAAELSAALKAALIDDTFDYFGLAVQAKYGGYADTAIPRYHHAVAYVVKGGSEGWYVHVDVALTNDGDNNTVVHLPIWVGKTFDKAKAWAAARTLAEMLDS